MAPLPPNSTARYRVSYTVGGEAHDFQVRHNTVSPSAFGTWANDFLTALAPTLNAVTISGVELALSGSNIFNPVSVTIVNNTYGSGAGGGSAIPNFINFIGRTSGGRRVRLALFGNKNDATDYRFLSGENAAIDAAIVELQSDPDIAIGIDGLTPVWYNYANAGVNAYWQRAIRP